MNPIYYRNRIDIITSILKIANGNEVKQVEILVKANITHTIFKEYLFHLFQSGLIEYIRFQRTYRTTTKGILFLSICDKMKNLIWSHSKFCLCIILRSNCWLIWIQSHLWTSITLQHDILHFIATIPNIHRRHNNLIRLFVNCRIGNTQTDHNSFPMIPYQISPNEY